jgi:hypothetical protein
MNIQRWKGLVWLGSLASGALLVSSVYGFLQKREDLAREVSDEELSKVLDSVKKPAEQESDHVDYRMVERIFNTYDWSGKEKPKPVEKAGNGEPAPAPKVQVASLLRVLALKVDTSKPEHSVAYVKLIDQKLIQARPGRENALLHTGERLTAPYADVRVEAITAEGVVFAFDDAARPKETVAPPPYTSLFGELGIVVVGPEGFRSPPQKPLIAAATDAPLWRPEQLTQIRRNEYQIGTETLSELDRDYSRILSRDISYSTHKNPRTGESDGIKVNSVKPGSIPAQAGLSEGEVLKSINGHRVTSVNDAIAYVKANAQSTDTWVAVFEKQGREFTRTYHSPE